MVDLVLEAPARGKPPQHLLDMSRSERREAVAELGGPAVRDDQVSPHRPTTPTLASAPSRALLPPPSRGGFITRCNAPTTLR